MRIYQENVKRFEEFYTSDYYSFLQKNNPEYIDSIFSCLCEDPDATDTLLYQMLGEKFGLQVNKFSLIDEVGGQNIRLSADIICGRKQIARHYKYQYEDWIKDYIQIRSNLNLHFLWPKQKAPSINTYCHNIYLDRIDYLLLDIKYYFAGQTTPMASVYESKWTAIWLSQFHGHFPSFIDKMKLRFFVDKEYNVLDIGKNQSVILDRLAARSEITHTLPDYLTNMLLLNRQGR